jgi:hypothetical protein
LRNTPEGGSHYGKMEDKERRSRQVEEVGGNLESSITCLSTA